MNSTLPKTASIWAKKSLRRTRPLIHRAANRSPTKQLGSLCPGCTPQVPKRRWRFGTFFLQRTPANPPHEPFVRSSRRKEAQASWAQGDQEPIKSLLTSAATVQGLNAGRFAWGNSFHEPKEACSRSLSLGNTGTGAEPSDQDLPATPDQIPTRSLQVMQNAGSSTITELQTAT